MDASEEELSPEQLRELVARHEAFGAVLAEGAQRLIAPVLETLDAAIDAYLGSLGRFADADRCYLFVTDPGGRSSTNTNEWCAPGIPPQKDELEQLPLSELPWFWAELVRETLVHLPRVSELDPLQAPERAIFESGAIGSLLCVAIQLRGEVVGFLGFDAVHRVRDWSRFEVELLRRATLLFAGVLERRDLERERLQLQDQLIHSRKLEAVGRLAGGVAHDFNNLLTVITGNLSIALRQPQELEPSLREDLKTARDAALRAGELTGQLLSFGRRQLLRPVLQDVAEELRQLAPLLRRLLREDVLLTVELEEPLPPLVADPALLPQVLLNLIANAGEAIEGAGSVRIAVRPLPREGATWLELCVEDDGPGLSEEVRARLFEPFFTTKAKTGTGLGLATVYGAVRQHGGEVEVESELGAGTALRVLLPPGSLSEAIGASEAPRAVGANPSWGRLALVVEDEPALRRVLARALEAAGWETEVCGDGREALELPAARLAAVELLVSDVVMPHVSGPELYRELSRRREGTTSLPALFISGYAGERSDDPTLRAAAYLQKPFTPDALLAAIARLEPARASPPGGNA